MQNNEYKTLDDFLGKDVKSGMVAIVGPPNAGKSTLMNQLLGQKISIVTSKPQTTRNRILGIVNDDAYQIVLLDTPGLHKADEPLNIEMMRVALESLSEVDAVLFLVDVSLPLPPKALAKQREELAGYMEKIESPAILVLNKVDLIDKQKLLPMIESYAKLFPFKAVVPISALNGDGADNLLKEILELIPVGPRYFPEDIPTDATERFLAAEIVREKVFLLTGQELPYSAATLVESFKEDEQKKLITIHATIVVERPSQKGMIIGKGGQKLKQIGTAARKDIEALLGSKVLLKLWVKVKKKWAEDENFLKELGF
ncbi:GTPase Era [Desulfotalea psychrophila]|uniref:GTPase Era n=1 Tax=Desulfotalea psychrophila (strain LSv54 / DSM 12343) TaxID=177439 RepID=Q6AMK7_DESPS|nr:GTPase Era [Desulfotalea psychrophila]CAG36418.1 probable GTP-binding protein Era homolog [Desulfotalea psychrophila LSv54]